MRWKKSCPSCMNPDFRIMMVILVTAGVLLLAGIVKAADWLESRGIKIEKTSCSWNESEKAYIAEISAVNKEQKPKLVSFNVRFDVRPPKGQKWPDSFTKSRYSTITRPTAMVLGRGATEIGSVSLPIPVENYSCKATVSVFQQTNLDKPIERAVKDANRDGHGIFRAQDSNFKMEGEFISEPAVDSGKR